MIQNREVSVHLARQKRHVWTQTRSNAFSKVEMMLMSQTVDRNTEDFYQMKDRSGNKSLCHTEIMFSEFFFPKILLMPKMT